MLFDISVTRWLWMTTTAQERDLKLLHESHHLALKQCRQSRPRDEVLRLEAEHMEKVFLQDLLLHLVISSHIWLTYLLDYDSLCFCTDQSIISKLNTWRTYYCNHFSFGFIVFDLPSVLWNCWLGDSKSIWPVGIEWRTAGGVILSEAMCKWFTYPISYCSGLHCHLSCLCLKLRMLDLSDAHVIYIAMKRRPISDCCCCCCCSALLHLYHRADYHFVSTRNSCLSSVPYFLIDSLKRTCVINLFPHRLLLLHQHCLCHIGLGPDLLRWWSF